MIIWHDQHDETEILAAQLADLAGAATRLEGIESLAGALARGAGDDGGGGPVLCLYLPPVPAVARDLAQGVPAAAAVAGWAGRAEALLELQRRHRRRVRLIDAALAGSQPDRLVAWLELPEADVAALDPPPDPDPVLGLIAGLALRADPRAEALAEELQAAAADFAGTAAEATGPEAAPQAALERYLTERTGLQTALRSREAEIAKLRDAQSLLKGQNRAQASELDQLGQELRQMETRLTQLGQGLDSSLSQIDTLKQKLDLSKERLADKNGQLETLSGEVQHLQGEIDRIMHSRSMRLTAPIRRLGRLLRRSG